MLQLRRAGLLADAGAQAAWDDLVVRVGVGARGVRGVKAVENQFVAVGIVHGWKSCYAFQVVKRRHGVHLVVVDLVPGEVPAGAVLLDAVGQLERAEVVADAGQTGHEGEVRAGDGEHQWVVLGVREAVVGNVVPHLPGCIQQRVLRVANEVEGLPRVGEGDPGGNNRERGEGQRGGWPGAETGEARDVPAPRLPAA